MIMQRKKIKILGLLLVIFTLSFLGSIIFIHAPKDSDWDYSTQILDENGNFLRVYLDVNDQWHLAYNDAIPEKLKIAILQFEDKHFYSHPGINPFSILRALYTNISAGTVVSGGSTITMQVARLYSQGDRNLLNKIKEALISIKLEVLKTKDEILLTYLNNAPYGSNIVGIETAAYKYYGKKLQELTWAEACLFAVLPNNPGYLFPGSNTNRLKDKRDKLLNKLKEQGYLTDNEYKNSIRESIPNKHYSFPLLAPHLSDKLHSQGPAIYNTTINGDLQKKLEDLAIRKGYLLNTMGIKNLAILVSNTKTHQVKAYIGSQNYFSKSTNGFNDGVLALRSSGSILKPFIYGYGLEKGLITPNSLLEDTKQNYGMLLPQNYDKQYRGLVTVSQALQKSLNIPAYEITQKIGLYDVTSVLKSVGMTSLTRDPSTYGLSICVGGAETNLWDLSQMYQTLGNYGHYNKLSVLKDSEAHQKTSLLSPASSYQILDILRGLKVPDSFPANNLNIAWKTGTSNGFRDAWAVGLNEDWTIAVWAGNFTGEGNHKLSGRNIAGDILFQVASGLISPHASFFIKPWSDFKQVPICQVSGYSPTKNCQDTLWIDVPKNANILPNCPYHKSIVVDSAETMQVCSDCWQGIKHKTISVLDYPPNVDYHLKENSITYPKLPKHNPQCTRIQEEDKLIIKYPINNSKIYLPIDLNGKLNSFQAEAVSDHDQLYWFLNNKFLGKTSKVHKLDIKTNPGKKHLHLVSQEGLSTQITFEIIINSNQTFNPE